MDLKDLEEQRRLELIELKAWKDLQTGLEYIDRYNRENIWSPEVIVVSTASVPPDFEVINENNVADGINRIYDRLLSISEDINQIKEGVKSE